MVKKVSWFVCFLVLAISCLDEPDCFRLNNNLIGVSFKKMYDGKADTVALLGIQAAETDSIFGEFTLTTGLYLPLDFFKNQTSFIINGFERVYQLDVTYDVKTQFVSDECGARYVLSNLALVNNDFDPRFDSIRLASSTPSSSEAGVHVEIYRCPRTHLVELTFRQLQTTTSVASPLKINSITDDYSGIMWYADTTLQTVYLPVNQAANSSVFDFDFLAGGANTISINYERKPKIFFEVCGDQQLFSDLDVVSHDFDSITIVKDSLQDPPVTNINVFRCPQTNLVRLFFRKAGTQIRSDTIDVVKINADYTADALYADAKLTFVDLPLNPDAPTTTFTFELEQGTKTITVGYTRTNDTLFDACGSQTFFTALQSAASNFTSVVVRSASVVTPTVTNLEIIQ